MVIYITVLINSRALKLVFKALADLSGHIFMSLLVSVEMVTAHNLLSILSAGVSPTDGIGNVCIWMTGIIWQSKMFVLGAKRIRPL